MNPELLGYLEKLYKIDEYGIKHPDPEARPHPKLVEYYEKTHGIKTDVHRTCICCQIRQIEKYKGFDKEIGDDFRIPCKFIPRALPAGIAENINKISAQQGIDLDLARKLALSTVDSVAWAELMLGFGLSEDWKLRVYQKDMLRCTAERTCYRMGRRSGKSFGITVKLIHAIFNVRRKAGVDSEGKEIERGPRVYVITPFQAQIDAIFTELENLIKRNDELTIAVKTGHGGRLYTKSPFYYLELYNGASISGFVSGIGVKQDDSTAGSLRGRGADIIYLDEMDMIPEDVIGRVIMPILHDNPDAIMLATSTPIGERGRFFKWTEQSPGWKSDYYPSSVLPHWMKIKHEAREEAGTEDNFRREYLAQFIDTGTGVFKPSLVHAARADYTYADVERAGPDGYAFYSQKLGIPDYKNMSKCIGIDWNKNAGTEFFISGYSHTTGKIVALEAVQMDASEFSGDQWIKELFRLNFKWRPNWIYADEGYGHTIIEDAKLRAHELKFKKNRTPFENETLKVLDRLVAFNFSQNVELRSPVDGAKFEKAGKHFLVENTVRILENNLFSFPENDAILTKQLINYIVVRRHPSNNKPVYGTTSATIGDHRLDAMMLSLGGIALECSDFSAGNIPISPLLFKGRDSVNGDYISPEEEAANLLRGARRSGVPAILNVLAIRRGNTPQDDAHVRKQWESEEKRFKTTRERGTLRNPQEEPKDILKEAVGKAYQINHRNRPIGTSKSQGRSQIRRRP